MVTVILSSYKRPHTLNEQLNAIKNQTVKPSDILLWHNESGIPFKCDDPSVKTIVCNHNWKYHGRFTLAYLAKTEYIAVFDDDTIPGNRWFENCINTMKVSPGILGTAGVYLTGHTYNPWISVGWQPNAVKSVNIQEVDLVGHCWFFKREWIKYFWMEDPISLHNGEDIQFSYSAQKYGKINSYVPPHPVNDHSLWGSLPDTGMRYGADPGTASSLSSPSSFLDDRGVIVRECIARGWKICCERGIRI